MGALAEVSSVQGGQATIAFTDIPATARHLLVVFSVRSTYAAVASDTLTMQCNGDTGANYDDQQGWFVNTGTGASVHSAATAAILGTQLATVASSANQFSPGQIHLNDYTSTLKEKTFTSTSQGSYAAGINYAWVAAGDWRGTAAINALTFAFVNGDFAEGSIITVYGLGAGGGGGGGGGGGATLSVSDGETTIDGVTSIDFVGATVSGTSPAADVAIATPVLFAIELAGGAATIDFTDIPDTARHLRIEGIVRSDGIDGPTIGPGGGIPWEMTLNGVASGGYAFYEQLNPPGNTPSYYFDVGRDTLPLGGGEGDPLEGFGGLPCDPNTAHMISFTMDIPYYAWTDHGPGILANMVGAGNSWSEHADHTRRCAGLVHCGGASQPDHLPRAERQLPRTEQDRTLRARLITAPCTAGPPWTRQLRIRCVRRCTSSTCGVPHCLFNLCTMFVVPPCKKVPSTSLSTVPRHKMALSALRRHI